MDSENSALKHVKATEGYSTLDFPFNRNASFQPVLNQFVNDIAVSDHCSMMRSLFVRQAF